MTKQKKIIGGVIHHSLTKDGYVVDYDAIKRYHINVRGWDDIGYHKTIERAVGEIVVLQGREDDVQGAHTKGFNAGTLGYCVVGNFDKNPPDDQTVEVLIQEILKDYEDHGEFLLFGHSEKPDPKTGYRKTCPGKLFPLQYVKDEVARRWADGKEHWAEKHFVSLNDKGIEINERRFDDLLKRGELMAVIDRMTD